MLTQSNRLIRPVPADVYTGAPQAFVGNNPNGIGLELFVNVTAVVNANTLTVVVEAMDPGSGLPLTLLASAAFSTTGIRRLVLHPAITAVANVSAQDVLGAVYRVRCVHGNAADAITYSVSANVLFA
jgi:hypothetical protein